MTNQPQSCRECRHARETLLKVWYCEWNLNVPSPPMYRGVEAVTFPDHGADCQAFERKDDADDK